MEKLLSYLHPRQEQPVCRPRWNPMHPSCFATRPGRKTPIWQNISAKFAKCLRICLMDLSKPLESFDTRRIGWAVGIVIANVTN
jgi:hypothetical protein